MGSKLAKTFRKDLLSHLVHHSSFWAWKKWKLLSLRMGSKLAKTFRTDLLSHFVHHSSFWAWKKGKMFELRIGSNLPTTFRTDLLSNFGHHSSFWDWKIMKYLFSPNGLQTCQNVDNGSLKPFGGSQLILSLKKKKNLFTPNGFKTCQNVENGSLSHLVHHSSFWAWKKMIFFSFRIDSKLAKTFRKALLSLWCITAHSELEKNEICFSPNGLKTCQNVANGSLKPFGGSQLILSLKKKNCSLRMGSKLAKTLTTALLSHLVDHSSFCAWKKFKNVFLSEWAQNLPKRSERIS